MLKINDNSFKLKEKDFQYIIIDNKVNMSINIITFLGIFNERMDDIKININAEDIKTRKLSDLSKTNVTFKAISNTWEDQGIGEIIFNKIVKNKLEVEIILKGEYDYKINTVLDASWVTVTDKTKYEDLDKIIDINDIEEIPFITETDEQSIIQYMFSK